MNQRQAMIFIRNTKENHDETPPACDEACWLRWYDMAHMHVCPDGINDPSPFMTITSWCSCGHRLTEPRRFDARDPRIGVDMEGEGNETLERFREHALEVHQIDIDTNEEWLRRLGDTPPGYVDERDSEHPL